MRSVYEGSLPVDDESVRTHIDRCLGCRACEPV
jgi:Fe-S oxidoreductase